jgi:hypothetical protein
VLIKRQLGDSPRTTKPKLSVATSSTTSAIDSQNFPEMYYYLTHNSGLKVKLNKVSIEMNRNYECGCYSIFAYFD